MLNTIISALHITTSILALIFGACIFFLVKGTRFHKFLGYGYVVSMALLNISALFIYNLTGYFGPFHYAAIFSFITLVAGFIPIWRRKPAKIWLENHYYFMSWCYAGLLAAAASEVMTRLPSSPFWLAVVITSALIFFVSGWLIFRYNPRDLAKHYFEKNNR